MNDEITSMNTCKSKKYQIYILISSIVFALTYILSLYLVQSNQMIYESREYPMWKYVKEQISSKKTIPLKMIVIGDSRAKAGYVPDLVSYEMLNLALGGSTIVEGYFTLLTYLKNNPPPENVVLSYSPYYLMKNSLFWERTVKYDFLQIDQYKSILRYSKIKNKSGIGTLDQSWKYKYLTSMYISSAITGLIKKRWKENTKLYKGLKESSGHAYFGVKNGSASLNAEVKQLDKFYRSDLIHFYFIKMIQLAKSYNVKLHWYTMPFNNASWKSVV